MTTFPSPAPHCICARVEGKCQPQFCERAPFTFGRRPVCFRKSSFTFGKRPDLQDGGTLAMRGNDCQELSTQLLKIFNLIRGLDPSKGGEGENSYSRANPPRGAVTCRGVGGRYLGEYGRSDPPATDPTTPVPQWATGRLELRSLHPLPIRNAA